MIIDWAAGWAVVGAGGPGVAWSGGLSAVVLPPALIVPEVVPAGGWRVLVPPELFEPPRLWVEGEARLALPTVQGRIAIAHVGSLTGVAAMKAIRASGRARVLTRGEDEWLVLDLD